MSKGEVREEKFGSFVSSCDGRIENLMNLAKIDLRNAAQINNKSPSLSSFSSSSTAGLGCDRILSLESELYRQIYESANVQVSSFLGACKIPVLSRNLTNHF